MRIRKEKKKRKKRSREKKLRMKRAGPLGGQPNPKLVIDRRGPVRSLGERLLNPEFMPAKMSLKDVWPQRQYRRTVWLLPSSMHRLLAVVLSPKGGSGNPILAT